jgi:hypothetical protein
MSTENAEEARLRKTREELEATQSTATENYLEHTYGRPEACQEEDAR